MPSQPAPFDPVSLSLVNGPPGIVVTSQLWAMEHLVEVPHGEWAVIGQYHSSFEAAAAGRFDEELVPVTGARGEVTADNGRAVRLYRKLGFRRVKTIYKTVDRPAGTALEREPAYL